MDMGSGLARDSGIRVADCTHLDSTKLSHIRYASQKTSLISALRALEQRQGGPEPLSNERYQACRRTLIGQMQETLKRTPYGETAPGFPSEVDSRDALNLSPGACVEADATVCEVGGSGSESGSKSGWAPFPMPGRRAPLATADVVPSAEAIPRGILPERLFCTGVEWGFQCKMWAGHGCWFEGVCAVPGSCQRRRMNGMRAGAPTERHIPPPPLRQTCPTLSTPSIEPPSTPLPPPLSDPSPTLDLRP